jgi:hypothetical protein
MRRSEEHRALSNSQRGNGSPSQVKAMRLPVTMCELGLMLRRAYIPASSVATILEGAASAMRQDQELGFRCPSLHLYVITEVMKEPLVSLRTVTVFIDMVRAREQQVPQRRAS